MSEIKRDRNFTTAELLFALPAGALSGASVVGGLIFPLHHDNQVLKAQVHYAETGDATLLAELNSEAWENFLWSLLSGGLAGFVFGLLFLQCINAARNAASEHSCSHRCTHHRPV